MTKAEMRMLEKAYEAEIYDLLPFQNRSKLTASLAERGYLQPMEIKQPFSGSIMLTISGWQLTHLGRLTYCASC